MKKILIPIIGISVIMISLISWQSISYSQTNLPYPNVGATAEPSVCLQSVANEMAIMRSAWDQNLRDMLNQEKACSAMVDEAFESMRTYRCWLDYLCETVFYSAQESPDRIRRIEEETGMPFQVTSEHITSLPGCVDPENVEIPGSQLKFLEECRVYGHEWLTAAQTNYDQCRRLVNRDFSVLDPTKEGSKSSKEVEAFKNQSTAFIAVERSLRACGGEKKNSALQNKLSSIIDKMLAMEGHMELLKANILKFDALLPCYSEKCD